MNKTKLLFETTAEIKAFIKRRKITHGRINTTDVTLTAVLSAKDIEIACKEYHATVVVMGKI
jgi:1-deoxy-D-xylulose 5-phosphate reductoisomerase